MLAWPLYPAVGAIQGGMRKCGGGGASWRVRGRGRNADTIGGSRVRASLGHVVTKVRRRRAAGATSPGSSMMRGRRQSLPEGGAGRSIGAAGWADTQRVSVKRWERANSAVAVASGETGEGVRGSQGESLTTSEGEVLQLSSEPARGEIQPQRRRCYDQVS